MLVHPCHFSGFFIFMNELIFVGDKTQTMTSREISELTNKNHADVLRDIRNLQEQVGNESIFALVDYKDGN